MSSVAEQRVGDRLAQPLRLFRGLYGIAEGWLELRARVPGAEWPERGFWPVSHAQALGAAAAWAVARSGRAHVWFGVNPRRRRGVGRAADIGAIVALAVDLDAKEHLPEALRARARREKDGFGWSPQALASAKRRALEPILGFPLPATFLVDSGHGWQAYWALKEPWIVEDDTDRRDAAILSRRLTMTLGGDATFDLARVLRVPGTLNVKAAPVACRVVRAAPRLRYDPAEIEPYLREIPAGTVLAGVDVGFNDVAAPVLEKLRVPAWAKRLIAHGDLQHRRPSRSEADMAVVQELVRGVVSPDEIRALYRVCPIGGRYREKGAYVDDYLARTIARAQRWQDDDDRRGHIPCRVGYR